MAFVFTSDRKLADPPNNEQFPSPAHYTIKDHQPSRNCAPFRTTSLRKVAFDQSLNKQLPGPGQYNIAREIIKPKITAYMNTSNVIIKVNSNGTPQFKSLTKRFDSPQKIGPEQTQYGQHAYFVVKKQRKKPPKHPMASRTINNSIKKFPPSIPTKIRGLLNPQNNQIIKLIENNPGPGDYNVLSQQKINSKGTIWAKDQIKRFANPSEMGLGGPGYYEVEGQFGNRRRQQTSNFKSGTVRTFFDTIMYNSCSEYIAQHRKKLDFKSPLPSPGQYAIEESSFKPIQAKPAKYQCFGSSTKRFNSGQEGHIQHQSNPFYMPDIIGANKSFNHLKPSFNSSSERNVTFLQNGQQPHNPGPGQYSIERVEPFKLKAAGKQIQRFGSTTERGIQNTKESAQIYPNINQNEAQLENELLKSRFGQLETQSSIFKSKTHRTCFSQAKNVTLNLDYDVTYNDVAKKIQRQKVHLQNLRKIDVYKAPFEINSPRFSHYEEWSPSRKIEKNRNETADPKDENPPKKVHSIGGKIGRQQRFHFERKGGGIPGVGNYEYKDQWKNNSHNVMFKYN